MHPYKRIENINEKTQNSMLRKVVAGSPTKKIKRAAVVSAEVAGITTCSLLFSIPGCICSILAVNALEKRRRRRKTASAKDQAMYYER
jgi:hypothetical protein